MKYLIAMIVLRITIVSVGFYFAFANCLPGRPFIFINGCRMVPEQVIFVAIIGFILFALGALPSLWVVIKKRQACVIYLNDIYGPAWNKRFFHIYSEKSPTKASIPAHLTVCVDLLALLTMIIPTFLFWFYDSGVIVGIFMVSIGIFLFFEVFLVVRIIVRAMK